jgi:hypothetical protein
MSKHQQRSSPLYTLLLLASISSFPEPSVPQDIVSPQLWRQLLQAPSSTEAKQGVSTTAGGTSLFLNLCETNLCESQRVDGVCDRWAKNEACSRRDIFYVRGDPGQNDKATMFFNLRSPWGISCSMVRDACEFFPSFLYGVCIHTCLCWMCVFVCVYGYFCLVLLKCMYT